MSGMDGNALFTSLALLLILGAVITAVAIRLWPARSTRDADERAKNQAEVEDWIARTKGADHIKRMRGED